MKFGIWNVTEEGIFGTNTLKKYYIERKQLAILINGEYIDMLVHIAQKTDVNEENIKSLNKAYRYAIKYFDLKNISEEVLENK